MELLGSIKRDYTVNVLKWGYLNKQFSENFILSVQQDIGNLLKEKIKKFAFFIFNALFCIFCFAIERIKIVTS